ncbi:MAG: restriction endonuclease [Burkholderiales bacterium]|nr:restriction endonuclease [Burkholderiales bacterium]
MAPQKSRPQPPEGGLRPLAIKLLVAGLLMASLPWALAQAAGVSSGGPVRAVANLGWLLSVLAGLIYLVGGGSGRRGGPQPGGERHSTHPSAGASRISTQPPASRFSPSSRMSGMDSEPDALGAPPSVWAPAVFRVIEWRRFEVVLEAYFAQAGFVTSSKSHGPDGGVDIWLYSRHEPGVPVSLVHGKHSHGKKVTSAQVREFMNVLATHQLRRGLFATASMFTPDGADYARTHHVQPLDPKALVELIEQRTPEEQKALLSLALQGEYWRPTCWKCQIKLVERDDAKDGKRYWGCANDPICKTTMGMRRPQARRL